MVLYEIYVAIDLEWMQALAMFKWLWQWLWEYEEEKVEERSVENNNIGKKDVVLLFYRIVLHVVWMYVCVYVSSHDGTRRYKKNTIGTQAVPSPITKTWKSHPHS